MMTYRGLHPKGDIDILYVKRKEGGRGLISLERCRREEENGLGFYVANQCMNNSSGKRHKKLMRNKRGNGYQEVI